MSDLVTWANGDGTFSYVPESQIPAMMQQTTQTTQPSASVMQSFELADILFIGAVIILIVATWKEPIGYFALGMLIAWVLLGVME
jgi:hypothetical protein